MDEFDLTPEQRANIEAAALEMQRGLHDRREDEKARAPGSGSPLDFNAPSAEEKADIRRRKAAITRRIKREVLAKYGIEKLPKLGSRVLVTGGQGTGKSRETAKAIGELPGDGPAVRWYVPTLEKAEEQAAEYNAMRQPGSLTARVVRGRGADDPEAECEKMCPRHEVVTRAAMMGVKVQEDICKNGCPFQFTCGFQRQLQAIQDDPSGLFVMASDYLWLPCPAPAGAYVIADESVIEKAAENVAFDPSRILDDSKWACPKDLDQAMHLRQIAILVHAAVTKHPGRELEFLRQHEVTDAMLKECADHLWSKEEANPAVHGRMTDKEIDAALDQVEAREIMKVFKLFRQIKREFGQPRKGLNSVRFNPNHEAKVDGEAERQPRVFVSAVRQPRLRKTAPVLCLDGTGSPDLNRKVFGEHMMHQRFAVPRDAEVYQVTGKTFSRQSITGTDRHGKPISAQKMHEAASLRAQVVEFLSLLPGKILLVSYKPVIEALIDELPEHVVTAHFGALRGLNSYEDRETVVVMGREQPSAEAIEALARPFTATDAEPFLPVGEYALQSRGRRMRDPDAPNVDQAQVHFDPRCQTILEQVREAEMVQAIDRVRPVFNHRKIIVLNHLPLDLTVDGVLTWTELKPDNFTRAMARHGVLPLAAVDLTRCFPDLWEDQKTADAARTYFTKKHLNSPNSIIIWSFQVFFGPVLKGTYRGKGRRGPLSVFLVRADLADPRVVLEGMVGELTEFTVELPPQPPAATAPHKPLRELPRMAAAMAAEGRLLASLSPYAPPPDMLGAHGVLALMTRHAEAEQRMAA